MMLTVVSSLQPPMWENLEPDHGFDGSVDQVWGAFRKKGATITKHENTKESAHRIIQLIASKSLGEGVKRKTVLHETLVDKDGNLAKTPLGEELRAQIEEDFDLVHQQLLENKKEKPPKEYKKSKDPKTRRIYKEWKEEKEELENRLETIQKKLKKMDSSIVSSTSPNLPTLKTCASRAIADYSR